MAETFQIFTSLRYDPALLKVPGSAFKHAGWNHDNASPFYMLDYHRDRMLRAATHWDWDAAVEVLSGEAGLRAISERALKAVAQTGAGPSRIRVRVSKEGGLETEVYDTPEKGISNLFPERLPVPGQDDTSDVLPGKEPAWDVVPDEQGTDRSEFTHFKTTRRIMYEGARKRAGIEASTLKEVLIINGADDSVMEGSSTTPYFWRDGRWVTPPVSTRFTLQDGSGGNDGTSRRWALERYVN